ncbi:M48 family metallopeptidase [Alicyclobacillus sendaiensis]|uniref:M48 family metallopeptidase n=1 Tax=Alicyclobacillus sendaiensis TaxID=192387 RepID=UPI00078425CD|nr:SprT family zinc-dependent metalloprotease [Alicyclobacillus sendaiensis]
MRWTTVRNHEGAIVAYEIEIGQDVMTIRVRTGKRTQKRIVLRADERGFSVSAPPWARSRDVEQVIRQNLDWLREAHAKAAAAKPKRLAEGDEVQILGRWYVIRAWTKAHGGVDHERRTVWVPAHEDGVHAQVYFLLRELARRHLLARGAMWAEQMALRPTRMAIKAQRSRWGSCTSKGHIYLNWKLIQAPEAVVDYVIVHELAHLVHLNHGPEFWGLVARFQPDWKAQRAWLRLHGHELFRLDLETNA